LQGLALALALPAPFHFIHTPRCLDRNHLVSKPKVVTYSACLGVVGNISGASPFISCDFPRRWRYLRCSLGGLNWRVHSDAVIKAPFVGDVASLAPGEPGALSGDKVLEGREGSRLPADARKRRMSYDGLLRGDFDVFICCRFSSREV